MKHFDANLYLNLYPELTKKGINNSRKAYDHWLDHGRYANKISNVENLNCKELNFDVEFYRALYPNISRKFVNDKNLLRQYLINGKKNGKKY